MMSFNMHGVLHVMAASGVSHVLMVIQELSGSENIRNDTVESILL